MTHLFVLWCFLPLEAGNHSRCTELIEVNFLSVGSTLGMRGTNLITNHSAINTYIFEKQLYIFPVFAPWWSITKYSVLQSSLFHLLRGREEYCVMVHQAVSCRHFVELATFGQQLFVGSPSKQVSGHANTRTKDDYVKCGCCSWPKNNHKIE